jgi:alcohol dehydrogenase (cytochrome c)
LQSTVTSNRKPLLIALTLAAAVALAVAVPSVRWRLEVLALHAMGRIPDVSLGELLKLIAPGSSQAQITRLVFNRNPYAVIHVPHSGPSDIAAGAKAFQAECSSCHGPDASGGPGAPALFGREFKHGDSEWALYRTIRYGVPKTAMMAHPLAWTRIWEIVAFLRSIDVAASNAAVPPLTQARLDRLRVPFEELASAAEPAADWLSYSGSYNSTRHSALTLVNRANVGRLALRWMVQLEDSADKIESSPVVRDGILFMTIPPSTVIALDATNGHRIWLHEHPYERRGGGEGPIGQNRGVAVLDERVFVGTWDAKLTALDIATGKVAWETTVDRNYPVSYISGAPLALRNLIVTGVGTASKDSHGFIAAYDARTGEERWRFESIPGPGLPGNETWEGDSWKRGGAGTWMTGSYDPQADILYWGIGNPKPDFEPGSRKGDNLYSDSVVALRGATGKLLWSFQFTPGDAHDWDSNQIPLIADQRSPAGTRKRLLWANRNGFYYVLDRETGSFLNGVPFVHQNWTQGLDQSGRPIPLPPTLDETRGRQVYPGAKGATNWWSPTYDPELNRIFVPVLEQGMVFFPTARTLPSAVGRSFYTAVRALDATTGERVWEHRQPARLLDNESAGLLSTRGGIVFGSDQSQFFALDAQTGERLWSVETGGLIMAAPVTYQVEGEQFVTIPAGRSVLTFALPKP